MSPWSVLGLEPTQDAKAIRRAYAARLRTIDADQEPAVFQRLRSAYEAALRGASSGVADAAPRATTVARGDVAQAAASPPAPEQVLDLDLAAAVERIKAALQAGEVVVAAEALGPVREALPLALAQDLTGALAAVAMRQVDLPISSLRLVLRTAGQGEREPPVATGPLGAVLAFVLARLQAERWYESLLRVAAERPRSRAGMAARLITARPASRWGWSYGWLLDWRPLLMGLEVNGRFLPGRFDPRAVDLARGLDARRGWIVGAALMANILLGAGLLVLWLLIHLPTPAAILLLIAVVLFIRSWLPGIGRLFTELIAPLPPARRALATVTTLAAVTGGAALVGFLADDPAAGIACLVTAGAVVAILSRWGIDWVVRLRAGRSPFAPARRRWWHFLLVLGAWLGLLALAVAALTLHGPELQDQVFFWLVAWMAARWLINRWRSP